ncbi:hypothetical protein [Gordonia paraffinivorans]|uniref:hypothetical protein n=1 Tax=Gordonia paraffinivorans TaxID=175628 RepID=UPI001FD47825|nr:hypothetical protein [Gordonia paraffinivorans]
MNRVPVAVAVQGVSAVCWWRLFGMLVRSIAMLGLSIRDEFLPYDLTKPLGIAEATQVVHLRPSSTNDTFVVVCDLDGLEYAQSRFPVVSEPLLAQDGPGFANEIDPGARAIDLPQSVGRGQAGIADLE